MTNNINRLKIQKADSSGDSGNTTDVNQENGYYENKLTINNEYLSERDENHLELSEKDDAYLYGLFEAVLFLSNEPLSVSYFTKHFNIDSKSTKIILDSIVDEYEERNRGIKLIEIAGGYQFTTNRRYSEDIRKAMLLKKKSPLSKGMLETLSIIAYKQPVTVQEINDLRGSASRIMLVKLMEKNLIKPVGRKELPGRPLLYATTDEFLKLFGLNKLSDLPKLSEIIEEFTNKDM